jgi:hypothetical protein
VILIGLRVEGADLALAERVIESGVDLTWRNIQPRSRCPVDDQLFRQSMSLLIRRNISQHA